MTAAELFSVRNKVALVTGASSGLGARFAELLAENGASVVLVARRAERLTGLQAQIEKAGGKAIAVAADVRDRAAMAKAFDAAEEAFGTVTILVNNAGVAHAGRAVEMAEEEWRRIVSTNLDAVFFWAQEAARRMLAANSGGSIVNIASVLGFGVDRGDRLCHGESRRHPIDQGAGARTRLQGHSGQRHRAGLDRHRNESRLSGDRTRHRDQTRHSRWPLRRRVRSRRPVAAARVRRRALRDRRDDRRRRRSDGSAARIVRRRQEQPFTVLFRRFANEINDAGEIARAVTRRRIAVVDFSRMGADRSLDMRGRRGFAGKLEILQHQSRGEARLVAVIGGARRNGTGHGTVTRQRPALA